MLERFKKIFFDGRTDKNIKLYDLLNMFNELYKEFKKEYDELDMSGLGEELAIYNMENGSPICRDEDYSRRLYLYVLNPTFIKRGDTVLIIEDNGEKITGRTCNSLLTYNYSIRDNVNVELDQEKTKKLLDLFEKYQIVFDLYKCLKHFTRISSSNKYLAFEVNTDGDDLLSGINNIKIYFDTFNLFSSNYNVRLIVNMGDNFGIDYEKSELLVDDEKKKVSGNAIFDQLLEDTEIFNGHIGALSEDEPSLDRVTCLRKVYNELNGIKK